MKKKMTWRDVPQVPDYRKKEESDSWTERSYSEKSGYDLKFGSTAKYLKGYKPKRKP